jgi:FkbM family methyltransferase
MRKLLYSVYVFGLTILLKTGVRRFRAVRWLNRFILHRIVKSRHAYVHGHRMVLDARDSLELSVRGVYEPFQTQLVQAHVKRGDTVVDVGAHIGYYTLLFAKLVGEEGRVLAFEPHPDNFALLQRNVEANGYTNVYLAQKAVAEHTGQSYLYLAEVNLGDHRIYDAGNGRKAMPIETVCLDDYLQGYEAQIRFIKLDIQGAEVAALAGMSSILNRNRDLKIMLEYWPFGLRQFGTEPQAFLEALLRHGFRLHLIDEDAQELLPTSVADLLERYPPESRRYANLLCLRES